MVALIPFILVTIGIGLPILLGIWPPLVFVVGCMVLLLATDLPLGMFAGISRQSIFQILSGYAFFAVALSVVAARLYALLYFSPKGVVGLVPAGAALIGGAAAALKADDEPPSPAHAVTAPSSQFLASIAQVAPFATGTLVVAFITENSMYQIGLTAAIFAVPLVLMVMFIGTSGTRRPASNMSHTMWSGYGAFPFAAFLVVFGYLTPTEALALVVLWLSIIILWQAGPRVLGQALQMGSIDAGALLATAVSAFVFARFFMFGVGPQDLDQELLAVMPFIALGLAVLLGYCGGPIIAVLTIVPMFSFYAASQTPNGADQFGLAVLMAGETGRFASARIGFKSDNKALDSISAVWIALLGSGSVLLLMVTFDLRSVIMWIGEFL